MAGVPQRATPAFVALFAIATTSCSPWTDVTPSAPLSIDDRLGTVILEVDEPRPVFVSSFFYEGGIYVSAYLGPGYDVDTLESDPTERIVVYRLDPASGEVTQLPDPPFAPGRRHYFTRVLSGSGIMMIAGEDDEEVAYFDGTSWTPRDNHPEYESTTGRLSAWGPNRLYYQRYDGRGVFIQDGGDWRALGPDLSDGTIAHAVAFTDDEIAFPLLHCCPPPVSDCAVSLISSSAFCAILPQLLVAP